MGSCGVLPNEIDCCNVNINKVQSEDERSKASRVRRTVSDQDGKSRSDRKHRGTKPRPIRSPKSSSKDELLSVRSTDRSGRRRDPPERRSSEIPEGEPVRLSTHRTLSEPIHHIESVGQSSSHSDVQTNQRAKYSSPANSFDTSGGQFTSCNTAEGSVVSCCSDSIISSSKFERITREAAAKAHLEQNQHRVNNKTKAEKSLQHTPTKKMVRSSSSNNLKERRVEAANAYRGRANRRKPLDSGRNETDDQGFRSLSRTRSGIKLRLRYKSPKKARAEIFENVKYNNNEFVNNDPIQHLSRSAHGSLQSSPTKFPGQIKLKRRISSKLSTGGSSQLPPLPASRDIEHL